MVQQKVRCSKRNPLGVVGLSFLFRDIIILLSSWINAEPKLVEKNKNCWGSSLKHLRLISHPLSRKLRNSTLPGTMIAQLILRLGLDHLPSIVRDQRLHVAPASMGWYNDQATYGSGEVLVVVAALVQYFYVPLTIDPILATNHQHRSHSQLTSRNLLH